MKIEEVVIKFEETVIKTSQRMTAIEAHFPDLKFSVMKIEVFSEGLYMARKSPLRVSALFLLLMPRFA